MNDIQRKWKKQIGRDSWMVKLQRLCFGDSTPQFVGYCPFFWFTWFCLIALPIALPIRGLANAAVSFAYWVKRPRLRATPTYPGDELLANFYSLYMTHGIDWIRSTLTEQSFTGLFKVWNWIQATPNWEELAWAARIRESDRRQRCEQRKQRSESRAALLRRLATIIAPVAKTVMVGLGLVVTYFVLRIFGYAVTRITVHELIVAVQIAGFFVLVFFVAVVGYEATKAIVLWRRQRHLVDGPNRVGLFSKIFSPIGSVLRTALEFIFETVDAVYTRECPLIEWGEETRPIARNGD